MSGRRSAVGVVKRLSGPSGIVARLWPHALVLLGQVKDMMGAGVTTMYLLRHYPDGVIRVGYFDGTPVVIIAAGGQSAETQSLVHLYVESGILDVFSFLESASTADDPALLSRAPEASAREPTGDVRFNQAGVFSYRPKRDGDSRLTPRGWRDKLRRKTPVSIYSGKLRLWAQALYGSERQDFDGSSGSLIRVGVAPLSPYFIGGAVLVTAPGYRYWLLTMAETITARRLELGAVGKLVRKRLLAGKLEERAAEVYMLADAVLAADAVVVGSAPEMIGEPLAYGWQATMDGAQARAVTIEGHGFGAGFTARAYALTVGFDNAGAPMASAVVTTQTGAIHVLDSLVVPAGEVLTRRLDVVGTWSGSVPVYGFYSAGDVWLELVYESSSTIRGFRMTGADARVAQQSSTPLLSSSSISEGYDERNSVTGSSLSGVNHATPGAGGDPPLPDGYVFGNYYWMLDTFGLFAMRQFDSGSYADEGSSLCVLPHADCTAAYLLKRQRRSVVGLTGNAGQSYAYTHRTSWPQISKTDPPPTHPISDGNPPAPIEESYRRETDYSGFSLWYQPSSSGNTRDGHGYFATGASFTVGGTQIMYRSANKVQEIANVDETVITSGSFTEGVMPGPGLVVTSVVPSSGVLAYLTGYDYSPGDGLSVGNWQQIIELDLIETTADAVLLSFESAGGVNPFAREPNAVAYEAVPHDTPAYHAMVGRI